MKLRSLVIKIYFIFFSMYEKKSSDKKFIKSERKLQKCLILKVVFTFESSDDNLMMWFAWNKNKTITQKIFKTVKRIQIKPNLQWV